MKFCAKLASYPLPPIPNWKALVLACNSPPTTSLISTLVSFLDLPLCRLCMIRFHQFRRSAMKIARMRRPAITFFSLIYFGTPLYADTKSESWADPNFVFCEGIGATGSGRVSANARFTASGNSVTVSEFSIASEYNHPHSLTGAITIISPDGSTPKIILQRAWFPEIGTENVRSLYLPRDGDKPGPSGQTPFTMKSGSKITVTANPLFSGGGGGDCPSSFSAEWELP